MYRKTFVEIDLAAIRQNMLTVRKLVGPDKKILAAVKADGYGHGAVAVSHYIEKNSLADMLGVASPEEGIELRDAGIKLPILVLGLILPEAEVFDAIIDNNLTQSVADMELANSINNHAAKKNCRVKLHLKVDTGMGRIGCPESDAVEMAKSISKMSNVELEGIFTHCPLADNPDQIYTINQIKRFKIILDHIYSAGINIPIKHMANSAALINFPEAYLDMVRPGIMCYGYHPDSSTHGKVNLKPVMTFKSCIIYTKNVNPDTPISYGHIYHTENSATIATVPVGYGDGYNRLLSNISKVIIRGKEYPLVGRVCMDQILINLGNDTYPVGEEVILFGQGSINAENIANLCHTIPYEITCNISKRVPRIYQE